MTESRRRVLEALRHYVVRYQEATRELAHRVGLPAVDGAALGEIVWAEGEGAPLSPARLAERVGLTSGATNALVNRLAAHSLVARSRESADRRIVTLRPTAQAHELLAPFLGRASSALGAALDEYDDRTLDAVSDFLDGFAAVLPSPDDGRDRRPAAPAGHSPG